MKQKRVYILFLIALLLLPEAAARLWLGYFASPDQCVRYSLYNEVQGKHYALTPHPYLNYYPTPGYKKGRLSHNSIGYRGGEFPVRKPDGTFRIAVLGGSTAYTTCVKDNELTFTSQLEKILKDKYGYEEVEVINAASDGYTSWESLVNLEFRVLDLEPDLVIVYHGTNDVHARLVLPLYYSGDNYGMRRQWEGPPVFFWEHSAFLRIVTRKIGYIFKSPNLTRQVSLESFICSPAAKYMYKKGPEAELIEVLKKNPPVYFRRNLRNMIAVAKANGVPIMLSTWAYTPKHGDYASTAHYEKGFKENNDVVKEVAGASGVPVFDFAGVMPEGKEYWFDGRHVNEKGALKKAGLFAEFIHSNGLIKRESPSI